MRSKGNLKDRPTLVQPKETSIRFIALTKNLITVVDAEDYDYLMQWPWHAAGSGRSGTYYATRTERKNGKKFALRMHNVIANPADGLEVDHKNQNPLDNRRDNLRECTVSDNLHNRPMLKRNKSGHKGVFFNTQKNRWTAKIKNKGKHRSLGFYRTPEEASQAYERAAAETAGEFAWNEIQTRSIKMTFTLNRTQLEAKRNELAAKGVHLVGDSGNFADEGVRIQFTYGDPTLIITVLDFGGHAKFIVNHIINDWFKH